MFKAKYLFWLVLIIFVSMFFWFNRGATLDVLSSDIWMNNFVLMQEKEQVWSYVPPAFNQEKYYVAYPLFYWLNPGLDQGLWPYFALAIAIIVATYIITGLVLKKVFNNWLLATLGALLVLLPHYICFTNIGLLSFRNIRGLALVFPFYLLLGHYWIIYGLKDKTKNILLGLLAALSVYLYPPFGVMTFPFFVLSAIIIYKKQYWRQILIFIGVYLAASSLFWVGHFSNGNSSMIDNQYNLSTEQISLQMDIIDYRIPDSSIRGVDFGTIKRTIVDTTPLFILLILSIFLVKKYRDRLSAQQIIFSRVNLLFTGLLLLFVGGVELINYYLYLKNSPPFFIEHLRLLRAFGFIWIAQAVLAVYILYIALQKKLWAIIIMLVLVFSPLYFSASFIRGAVRLTVPEDLRQKYNLAPEVDETSLNSFVNLEQAARWARENLSQEETKVFVFSNSQQDFKFKILSRLNTNLTEKEGSLWVTSNFQNSQTWYQERMKYDQVIESAADFGSIINFAKELNCTHILLPRGELMDLYEKSSIDNVSILYSNYDYKIIKIN